MAYGCSTTQSTNTARKAIEQYLKQIEKWGVVKDVEQ